jgi:hypothetical protein
MKMVPVWTVQLLWFHDMRQSQNIIKAKQLFVLIFLFIILFSSWSQESDEPLFQTGVLFVNTNPMGSQVVVDGKLVMGQTPVLLRDLLTGEHTIELHKNGFETFRSSFTITPDKSTVLEIPMQDSRFISSNKGGNEYNLPQGTYNFTMDGSRLRITPAYENCGLIRALNMALPVTMAFSGFLVWNDLTSEGRREIIPLSPKTISAIAFTWGVGIADLTLIRKKRKLGKYFQQDTFLTPASSGNVVELFDKAEQLLSRGLWASALDYYSQIVSNFPFSVYLPSALYKIGKIHNIQGEYKIATSEFLLIVEKYPIPDLYDKTLKSLADIAYESKQYESCLAYLDMMVFHDPLFTRHEIEDFQATVLEKYNEDEGKGE